MSRLSWLLILIGLFACPAARAGADDYARLKAQAEAKYEAKSFSQARDLYQQAARLSLSSGDKRWVDFRLADTTWRTEALATRSDQTSLNKARADLEKMVAEVERVQNRDQVWAEAHESLASFYWRKQSRSWYQAWRHYEQALDWWAGAADLKLARRRYLAMALAAVDPPWKERYYYYGYHGNWLPVEVVENILAIAPDDATRARAHYLLAMTLRNRGGDYRQQVRIPAEFEAALKVGQGTDWFDDALFHYAQHMENRGRLIELESGGFRSEPDFAQALVLYRRLVGEFDKGETRYFDDAKNRIRQITERSLSVSVSNVFLPGSSVQYQLNWRNLKKVQLSLHAVDLTRAVAFAGDKSAGSWLATIDLGRQEKIRSWTFATKDEGKHLPGSAVQVLDGKLPVGAYVLEARAEKTRSRELVLITDAALVIKSAETKAVAFFCQAESGEPLADGAITMWARRYENGRYVWEKKTAPTDRQGLAAFDLKQGNSSADLFVAAKIAGRQAFSLGYANHSSDADTWRVYAFTDRPAYRPEDEVQFKFIVRGSDGKTYHTPAGEELVYRIDDARGSKVVEDKGKLNAFGAMWGSLKLTESMPLGEYRISFWTKDKRKHVGSATLFRLEEYKLPEFSVRVETPEQDGLPKVFRMGDPIEARIQVDYYFGGAVTNADVEVIVYQRPFYHTYQPPREFPWFYSDMTPQPRGWWGGYGSQIKRERLKTDPRGQASIRFDTPVGGSADYEYRIEARVTDSSRREVSGSGTVRVTRQDFFVHAAPRHVLYRPQGKVEVDFTALDANSQPVRAKGNISVTRMHWFEIWLGPDGQQLSGDKLALRRRQAEPFPPADGRWRLIKSGYESEQVLERTLATNGKGQAVFSFTPAKDGYYAITWQSPQSGRGPVQASTTVWVASEATQDMGYHHGGLQLIVDRDTFRVGQKAPVMVVAPTSNRWVLFSVEGEQLHSWQVVHLEGTVRLITIDVTEEHVPNIYLSAQMVADRQLFSDVRQVVVPPERHFLNVSLRTDKPVYLPRDQARIEVQTRDHHGKPVAAEVGLSLVDESVYYIQSEYAADPRQYFYGQKRQRRVQTRSTFQHRAYVRLLPSPRGGLVDERMLAAEILAANREQREREAGPGGLFGSKSMRGLGDDASAELEEVAARDEAPASASASAPARRSRSAKKEASLDAPAEPAPAVVPADGASGSEPAVQVRSDFRATALWRPDLVTDRNGRAQIQVQMPDNLTGWKAVARAASATNQFGVADAQARTRMPLLVRLQAPRFFVVGDELTISAVVNNNTDKAVRATVDLFAEGLRVLGGRQTKAVWRGPRRQARVPANGESRLDFRVRVERAGPVRLKVVTRGGKLSDAMEKKYVAYDHGIEKMISSGGKLRGDEARISLAIPPYRPGSASLTVQVAPSLATTMLDALPYLVDYPYGCTEQTMSRFVPLVVSARTLKDLGLEPGEVMHKAFGGIETAFVDRTQAKGKRSLEKMDDMTRAGLARLYDFQHGDGGWGWWKIGDSDRFMTAYVLWGLTLAAEAGVDVRQQVLDRAVGFLNDNLVKEESSLDRQAWLLHALAAHHHLRAQKSIHRYQAKAFDNLWSQREHLNSYSRALLTLSAVHYGFSDKARVLVDNLADGVIRDDSPDTSVVMRGAQRGANTTMATARWGKDRGWWNWSDGAVETTAFVLRALVAVDAAHPLVEPAMNWLVKNRRGSQWSNTRDTAIAVLALNDYLKKSRELGEPAVYTLSVNGRRVAEKKLSGHDLVAAPSTFTIDPAWIHKGDNEVVISKKQGRALYFFARADFFSLEEPIAPAANEIFIRRQYYKWVGRPSLFKGEVFERKALNDGETVVSGQRVEVVVTVEAKNDYEYLVFEDLKPAGLEAVQIRSGEPMVMRELKLATVAESFGGQQEKDWRQRLDSAGFEQVDYTGRSSQVHQELRDRKVALFVDRVPQGTWELRYDLRAEVPGSFHALPLLGHAMYVPEIRANGAEIRLEVFDRP